jgi:hypothetical protein
MQIHSFSLSAAAHIYGQDMMLKCVGKGNVNEYKWFWHSGVIIKENYWHVLYKKLDTFPTLGYSNMARFFLKIPPQNVEKNRESNGNHTIAERKNQFALNLAHFAVNIFHFNISTLFPSIYELSGFLFMLSYPVAEVPCSLIFYFYINYNLILNWTALF